ncbi:MAG: cryptochrome/photolyase family protein [Bacteroidota bacterium]
MPKTLRLILGDQLNAAHSWFETVDEDVIYLMMEMRQETDYVKHHVQKVIAFFAAMRAFCEAREAEGHRFHFLKLDDPNNQQSLAANLQQAIEQYQVEQWAYQLPDEYRLDEQLRDLGEGLGLAFHAVDTEHFLTQRGDLATMFKGKKTYLMESFYRRMRKQYDILMVDEKTPFGERWNFDADNRNRYDGAVPIPEEEWPIKSDQSEILAMIEDSGVATIGEVQAEQFIWPVSRKEAEQALDFFVRRCLPQFGTYQDAMTKEYWALFHSRLSFAMNSKILHPLEVVRAAIAYWEQQQDLVSLAQLEGFVRQIIGWREYMRGVYWAHMPSYAEENYFGHNRKLPDYFWTGETKMACVSHAVIQSLTYAYAHHIQRLMVTGNFALLAGISPDELDEWYLGIYIDAIEWVEITNTRGMSQFADGGKVGTKPYVSSANYIDKMSDYCGDCHYKKKLRHGEKACPFNSLYWHFYDRNEDKLARNPRIGFAYRTLNRMKPEEKEKTLLQAEQYLAGIEDL